MRIAILSSPDSWYVKDLRRAARSDYKIIPAAFSQMAAGANVATPTCWSGQIPLDHVDAILVRTMPPGSLEQVVFRMDGLLRLEASGMIVMNPPRAVEAAVDKYLATTKIHAAGLRTPSTIVCQTVDAAMQAFEQLGGDVVVKPIFGSEGRGIVRIADENVALRVFKTLVQIQCVIYLQRFIEHEGFDIRLFVLGKQVLGMRRRNWHDWRTNVSRGAKAQPLEPDNELIDMARQAADAIGAPLAGVDLLPARDGNVYVLEVNAVPGWKALSATLDVDVAAMILEFLKETCQRRRECFESD